MWICSRFNLGWRRLMRVDLGTIALQHDQRCIILKLFAAVMGDRLQQCILNRLRRLFCQIACEFQ
jgi:hypothetical protein